MPVNNQGGGGWSNGGGRGPWGQGPQGVPPGGGGGGGQQPPDLEDLLRQGRDRFKSVLPGGKGGPGAGGIVLLLVGALFIYLFSIAHQVGPNEQGVVTRFGAYVRDIYPGLNFVPWPVEQATVIQITDERSADIGFERMGPNRTRPIPQESLMLTGDENIVDMNFTVLWVIKDAAKFLFNVQDQSGTVKAVAESAMREVVGRRQLEAILTQERTAVQVEVQEIIQKTLDGWGEGAGIEIRGVQLRHVGPPSAVVQAFQDVQTAEQDQEKLREDARKYAGKIIPEARGEAQRILRQAEAYKEQVVAEAEGDASRFVAILNEYKQAPRVTRERIYYETMERVMSQMEKVILDTDQGGQGVVPYLPLPSIERSRTSVSGRSQGSRSVPSQSQGGQQ